MTKTYDIDDLWPIAKIAEMLNEHHIDNCSRSQMENWVDQRETNSFPEPAKVLGRYKLYSYEEVKEWVTLWRRATAHMGRGKELNS